MEGFKSKNTYSSVINTKVNAETNKQPYNLKPMEPQNVNSLINSGDNISEIAMKNSIIGEDFISENEKFLETGKNLLGEVDEKEIELTYDIAEKYIKEKYDEPVRFSQNRSEVINDAVEKYRESKTFIASETLLNFNRKVVKKGMFSPNALNDGKLILKKLDENWVGKHEKMSDTDSMFYENLGKESTLDFLKVDGMSLKDFVKKKYNYSGTDVNGAAPEDIYSAYVAMILRRQNHSITLVRPTFNGEKAEIQIQSLNVIFQNTKTWGQTGKNIVSIARNKQYQEYHEIASMSENLWEAAAAVEMSTKKKTFPMKELLDQKRILTQAGKGTHKNYDKFVSSYDSLMDSVAELTVDLDQTINKKSIEALASKSQTVIEKAQDYLKGKKMNLARHYAVQNILTIVQSHLPYYQELENSKLFKSSKTTISVNDLIADNIQQKIDDMNFETIQFKDKMTKEEFFSNGGAVLHRYVTIEEADKYVKESGGMICAIPVEGQPLLRELRPSLPKTTMIGEKEVPLCKSMQYLFKAIAVVLVDKNGKISPVEKEFDGAILEDRIDQVLALDPESCRPELVRTALQTIDGVFNPIIKDLLNENYMKEGKQVDSEKLSAEADEIVANIKTLYKSLSSPLNHSLDVNFMKFRLVANFLKTLNYDEFMQRDDIKDTLKLGFTEEEIKDVMEDFKKDLENVEKDLSKLRNLDMRTDEIPCFQTSMANCSYFRNMETDYLNIRMAPLEFEIKNTSRSNPQAFADYLDNNIENIIIADSNIDAKEADQLRKDIKTLKDDLDKNKKLTNDGKAILDDLTIRFRKYESHESPTLAVVNDNYITVETAATTPDELVRAPLTMNGYMGQYRVEKDELKALNSNNALKHKASSYQKYHLHDNYFGYFDSRKKALKTRIAYTLKTQFDKEAIKKSR